MSRLQPTLQKLASAQAAFLRAADSVASSNWKRAPSSGVWSAAELVAHLCQVERGVLSYADRVIRKTPRHVPFYRRFHFPIALVESRVVRRRAPVSVQPVSAALAEKETMLAALRSVRERTLAFLEETHRRDLRPYLWPHVFLGQLNFYEWFTFVAAHQNRHTKQMLEIAQNLPKGVASSRI